MNLNLRALEALDLYKVYLDDEDENAQFSFIDTALSVLAEIAGVSDLDVYLLNGREI